MARRIYKPAEIIATCVRLKFNIAGSVGGRRAAFDSRAGCDLFSVAQEYGGLKVKRLKQLEAESAQLWRAVRP